MIGGILDREINRNQQISTNFKLSIEKTLQNSFGCVNAIKYTDKLILTGGDDKRILVYDNDYNLTQYKGHISNIFSIDAIGTKIYSTGNDGYLMEYDINQTSRFGRIRVAHEDACHKLTIQSENIILTAGQDYCCKLWDTRVEDPVGVLERRGRRINGVDFRSSEARMAVPGYADYNNDEEDSFSGQDYDLDDADNDININDEGDPFLNRYLDRYHTNSTFTPPPQPDFSPIFLTCDDQGGLNLYDIRTAFTSKHHIPLKTFNTRLGRVKESLIQYARKFDISSAKFSPCGGYIGITIQKFNPLLYSVEGGPEPVAVLEGDGFSSLATIKTGEFCTTLGQTLFMAGGDDGGVYGWKIPECHGGLDGSRIPSNQRLKNDMFFINDEGGFVQPNVIKESLRLAGSSAIINSVSCHPSLPYLVTAGVEKVVRIYSPHKIPVLDGKTKGENRDIRTEPDEDTLEFFKMLVRREQIGVEQYLWRRFRFDVVSVTDEDSERIDSDEDDSTSDDSWSEYGVELMPQDYDNDSNISAE